MEGTVKDRILLASIIKEDYKWEIFHAGEEADLTVDERVSMYYSNIENALYVTGYKVQPKKTFKHKVKVFLGLK